MSGETLRAPRQQLRRLRASAFDLAIDFQGLLKSASIARLSGARRVFGFSRDALTGTSQPRPTLENQSQFLKNPRNSQESGLAKRSLGIPVPEDARDFAFPIATSSEHRAEALSAIEGIDGGYVVLNPGGGWPTKLWSAERFGELADHLWSHFGLHSLVTVGPGEEDLAKKFCNRAARGRLEWSSFVERASMKWRKVRSCTLVATLDPLISPLRRAHPIVGLFGPTEWWRNGSPRPEDICVERVDIGCRTDCHRRACSNWICMDIEVDRVFQAAQRRLADNFNCCSGLFVISYVLRNFVRAKL